MAQLEEPTVAGLVDYKGHPAIRLKHGKWRSSAFIIGVEMGERLSYFGVSANLINFLTKKLGQSTGVAASNVNIWFGVSYMLPILGAVIADSCLGKYYTIIVSSIIYILGLGMLTLSAMMPSRNCTNHKCAPNVETIVFFIGLYMVAIGQGGHMPCVQAFGADQFDEGDPNESKAKSSFFNWSYFGLCMGNLVGIAVLSYTEENLSRGLGFGIPCMLMVIVLFVFVLGTDTYRYSVKSEGKRPFRRIGRVLMVAARNWRLPHPVPLGEDEAQRTQAYHESRLCRFLDKALIAPEVLGGKGCSKSEVEEAKAVLRLFPIWATSSAFGIILTQPPTFFTVQSKTLDRSIGSRFEIPAAALLALIGIIMVLLIPIYDRLLVPLARASTGQPRGISMLQRTGVGLFVSTISMVVAALVENKRLKTIDQNGLIDSPEATIPMGVVWLLPQYALFGVSEVFTVIGLQEFFYDQVPKELRSVGLALYISIFGVGSLISGLLISIIDKATSKGGRPGWFLVNSNAGHFDYFYWLLAGLGATGLVFFIYFTKSHVYNKSTVQV